MRSRSLVVIDGEACSGRRLAVAQPGPGRLQRGQRRGAAGRGVAAPVHHLHQQVPLARRVQHDRPRRYGVGTGVVGNRRAAAQRLEAEPRRRRRDRQSGQARPSVHRVQRDGGRRDPRRIGDGVANRRALARDRARRPAGTRRDGQPAGRHGHRQQQSHVSTSPWYSPARHNIGMELTHFGHSCLLANFKGDSGQRHNGFVRSGELLARFRGHHRPVGDPDHPSASRPRRHRAAAGTGRCQPAGRLVRRPADGRSNSAARGRRCTSATSSASAT